MHYMLAKAGWHCQFLEEDCKTPLRKTLTFQDPQKIVDMAKRGGADFTSADREALEYGIKHGRGAVWLKLTEEQYRKLQ